MLKKKNINFANNFRYIYCGLKLKHVDVNAGKRSKEASGDSDVIDLMIQR